MEIVLASNSPRRKQLLSTVIGAFQIVPSTIEEEKLKQQIQDPERLASALSFAKAYQVFSQLYTKEDKPFTVIGADSLVSFEGNCLGKPKDEADAIRMLTMLQGKEHIVYTGMTVIVKKEKSIIMKTVTSYATIFFKPMSHQDILDYVATKEPLDKAGAYAIQGIGKQYLKGFEGDYHTIVGLDIQKLKTILETFHVI